MASWEADDIRSPHRAQYTGDGAGSSRCNPCAAARSNAIVRCACKCSCCVVASFIFLTLGTIGLSTLAVVFGGNSSEPVDPELDFDVISHRGQPKNFPESSSEGYVNLPQGIVWEADIQPRSSDGKHYVAHDPVVESDDASNLLTLEELLELAQKKKATLMPEIKGDSWEPSDIEAVSRRLCPYSAWIQTYQSDHIEHITRGCITAKILCLQNAFAMSTLGCDGEGRYWAEVFWVAIRRWISDESGPLFFFTLNSRLHLRAVAAIIEPMGAFSDNAPGLLGFHDAPELFGNAFAFSFLWFTLCCWFELGLLILPKLNACYQRFRTTVSRPWKIVIGVVFCGVNIGVFILGCIAFESLGGFLTGFVTSGGVALFATIVSGGLQFFARKYRSPTGRPPDHVQRGAQAYGNGSGAKPDIDMMRI